MTAEELLKKIEKTDCFKCVMAFVRLSKRRRQGDIKKLAKEHERQMLIFDKRRKRRKALEHGLHQAPLNFANKGEKELFERTLERYLRHYKFAAPNDVDILSLGLWAWVKLTTAVKLMARFDQDTAQYEKLDEYFGRMFSTYMTCMRALGLTYTSQVRKLKEPSEELDPGRMIPKILEKRIEQMRKAKGKKKREGKK